MGGMNGFENQQRDEFSYDQERQMHYILDEGISELKKSGDTDKSGISQNQSSERSFTLRNQLNQDQESRSNSREFKRPQNNSHPERYPPKQINLSNQRAAQQNKNNILNKNESSSLRVFLEELKNEEHSNINNKNRDYPQQQKFYQEIDNNDYNKQQLNFSPQQLSSLGSSANIEMLKIQEESFSKIHNDIASLQNKIKGLETKLGSKQSLQQQVNSSNQRQVSEYQIQQKQQQLPLQVFAEKQDFNNRHREEIEYEENEDRIRKYKQQSTQQSLHKYHSNRQYDSQRMNNSKVLHESQEKILLDKSAKENLKIRAQEQLMHNNTDEISLSEDSDTQSYQTFPLRLKKQLVQQQQEIDHQREELNLRFNQPKQMNEPSSVQIVRERYEAINDSNERKPVSKRNKQNNQKLQYQNQVRSLTETDQFSGVDDEIGSQRQATEQENVDEITNDQNMSMKYEEEDSRLNDSTISVSEKMKQRIKQKMKDYKKQHNNKRISSGRKKNRSSSKKRNPNRSLSASLKRSNTQDLTKKVLKENEGSRVRRQVRFSETKKSSQSRRNSYHEQQQSKHHQTNSSINIGNSQQPDIMEVKRQNSNLRLELDQLRRKYEVRDQYYNKYRDLKVKYKSLQDDYKAIDLKKREQKEVIDEQKLMIAKLKKKLKLQKEKVKKLKGESPDKPLKNENKNPHMIKSVSKSYKQFKTDENSTAAAHHQRQKSQKKLQPSDINIRTKSKLAKMKRL